MEPDFALSASFDDSIGHGLDWSAVWEGYIKAPQSGAFRLHLSAWKPTGLELFDRGAVRAGEAGVILMCEIAIDAEPGEAVPFRIDYSHAGGGAGGFEIKWSRAGSAPETIPADALFFDTRLAKSYRWKPDPDPAGVDWSRFANVDKEQVIVFYEEGRATGSPANNAFATWGDEILLTFAKGHALDRGQNHSIDPARKSEQRQLRSRDGGLTWTEEPFDPKRAGNKSGGMPESMDFDSPGFAMRAYHHRFFFSTDRGHSWHGPFEWPDFGVGQLTSRTDWTQIGGGRALIGLSVAGEGTRSKHDDRTFFVEGAAGKPLRIVGWLTPPEDEARDVMPDTVHISGDHFLTAVRRKSEEWPDDDSPPISRNWIELYESTNGARSWRSLGEIAETDNGRQNGNPPSLVHLGGDSIAAIYGYRGIPYTIRARVSRDIGRTWGPEILLNHESTSWDMGYVRSAMRTDGRVVSIYYLPTEARPELHFEATIWDPRSIKLPDPDARTQP
jgi:hypothetical protein